MTDRSRRFAVSDDPSYQEGQPGFPVIDRRAKKGREWLLTVWGNTKADRRFAQQLADLLNEIHRVEVKRRVG